MVVSDSKINTNVSHENHSLPDRNIFVDVKVAVTIAIRRKMGYNCHKTDLLSQFVENDERKKRFY